MSNFHTEEKHNALSLLFDSSKIEKRYKENVGLPYLVVMGKEENRIESMVRSASELGKCFTEYKTGALAVVCIANSYEEGVMMHAGLLPVTVQGVSLCLGCMSKAIQACEEQLEVLRDIEKLVKGYATKL